MWHPSPGVPTPRIDTPRGGPLSPVPDRKIGAQTPEEEHAIMRCLKQLVFTAVVAAIAWQSLPVTSDTADAEYGWNGRRRISYQHSKDLFYNQYVGPGPGRAAAEMYTSPMPVPAHVGHMYNTYQPFYPNEYLYQHTRSYYNYHPGAGWTRTNARYGSSHCWFCRDICSGTCNLLDWDAILHCCP